MSGYGSIPKEETFNAAVFSDFFSSPKWAESKKNNGID